MRLLALVVIVVGVIALTAVIFLSSLIVLRLLRLSLRLWLGWLFCRLLSRFCFGSIGAGNCLSFLSLALAARNKFLSAAEWEE